MWIASSGSCNRLADTHINGVPSLPCPSHNSSTGLRHRDRKKKNQWGRQRRCESAAWALQSCLPAKSCTCRRVSERDFFFFFFTCGTPAQIVRRCCCLFVCLPVCTHACRVATCRRSFLTMSERLFPANGVMTSCPRRGLELADGSSYLCTPVYTYTYY